MYHHFADKADLFRAVFEAVEEQVMVSVATAAMAVDDPVEQLRSGCHAYLDTARDPGVRRICIIDAPAVLDEQVRREIATANVLGMVREGLEASIAQRAHGRATGRRAGPRLVGHGDGGRGICGDGR